MKGIRIFPIQDFELKVVNKADLNGFFDLFLVDPLHHLKLKLLYFRHMASFNFSVFMILDIFKTYSCVHKVTLYKCIAIMRWG